MALAALGGIVLEGGEVFECVFRIPATSAACVVAMGFMDSGTTAAVVDGCWVEFVNGTATAKSSKASSVHSESLGTVSVNTWYRVKIVIEPDLDAAIYYIYNADGSILASIGIGGGVYMPTAPTGCVAKAYRTNTTNTNLLDLDYLTYYSTKTLVR